MSARVTHEPGRACRTVSKFEPYAVLWSQDPPFQAWPRGYVHRRADAPPYLTSPVRGTSASALVALARQQASNPRAPTGDFRRLIALEPAQVRAELLAPRPSTVTCRGAQHRLALRDGELAALDHPGVDLDDELVGVALGGPPLVPCLSLLASWRERTASDLRRNGLGHLLVLDTERRWLDQGEDPGRREPWTARGLGPDEVAAAADLRMGERDLVMWSTLALPVADLVRWWRSGWSARDALALRLEGLTAAEAVAWREQGLDVTRIREGRRGGLTPGPAGRWYDAGWPLAVAAEAVAAGQALEEAELLAAAVGRRSGVPALLRSGVTVESAQWWTGRGHTVRELVIMAEDGMDLSDLRMFDSG